MKRILKFYALIIILFLSCCIYPVVLSEEEDQFALYLLKNEALTTKDVQKRDINFLNLKDTPAISYEDITAYQKQTGKFYLKEKLACYFNSCDTLKIFSELFGKPFIIVANGERIFLGSFIPGISSWTPDTPCILDYTVKNDEKSFIVTGGPSYNGVKYIDPRNDQRFLNSLSEKIIY